jgi:hypothetical protein
MKRINIIYWIFTGLLAVFILISAIPSIMNTPESQALVVKHLGYPIYFNQFLGVAKVLGVVAILVPCFPKIREWAYAGLTFDLISALYSFIAVGDPVKNLVFFPVFFAILAVSYIFWHKKLKAAGLRESAV